MTKTPISHIADLAQAHNEAHQELTDLVSEMEAHFESVRKQFSRDLSKAVVKARATRARLKDAIEAAPPETFAKPRTLNLNGVEVGLKKGKDALEVADDANAVAIIKAQMPALVGTAIKVEESLVLATIKGFNPQALALIGAKIVPGEDAVVIKEATSAVAETVKALLSAKTKAETEAA